MVHPLSILLIPATAFIANRASTIYSRLNIPYPITLNRDVPTTLSNHRTVTSIINPSKLPALSDTHEIVIPWPRTPEGGTMPNEQVLARLCYGFFGGIVLTPERTLLGFLRKNLIGISALDAVAVPQEIWSRGDLPPEKALEVGSKLYGTFQVVDQHIAPSPTAAADSKALFDEESFVTFAYGYDEGLFKGAHRFYVSQAQPPASSSTQNREKKWVRLRMSSTNVVTSDSPYMQKAMDWSGSFHLTYANLLFRDAVAEVLSPYEQ
ncbi:hypothetical protein LTR78_001874 [Recurvomyces mirabilis]|uniref:Uncharacterized protein n=1 Tax=Recurvomyces mirabilis TaxID=574656 RepID=A0AAE1C5B9_9PEZI|nr:hypothetical protein LTR78_001874 [Recurvomyces mirabilis]KAK5156686.1 hypothetical protein LTS14_004898 [Recurvomyces mirabilis]